MLAFLEVKDAGRESGIMIEEVYVGTSGSSELKDVREGRRTLVDGLAGVDFLWWLLLPVFLPLSHLIRFHSLFKSLEEDPLSRVWKFRYLFMVIFSRSQQLHLNTTSALLLCSLISHEIY